MKESVGILVFLSLLAGCGGGYASSPPPETGSASDGDGSDTTAESSRNTSSTDQIVNALQQTQSNIETTNAQNAETYNRLTLPPGSRDSASSSGSACRPGERPCVGPDGHSTICLGAGSTACPAY